ncbi:response regulator transcription factor (plasmid) [Novosphingobium sp. BL-8A]|uniref:response regulator n=1 Tax=Novosphingobium sp. BL-8A TaxID=3127639 RepID=UPI003756F3DD
MHPQISRILIVDDHPGLVHGVRALLEADAGFAVVAEAHDGREALKLALELAPDIAIIDYSLPSMNGLELVRAIKSALPDTEILIYSMHDRENILIDSLRAGARGYVLKSDSCADLVNGVRALTKHAPYFSVTITETLLRHYIGNDRTIGSSTGVLTAREREIIQLVAEGKHNKEVASILGIGAKTVEAHRASAMQKLRLGSTAELVLYAVRHNIVVP